jgi:NAD(P)-dependent dehydrogenase (short-subunit alcohol dehydrogenase family)
MNTDLSGKAALITGASSGLGLAIAGALRAAGADIAICARNPDKLEAASTRLKTDVNMPHCRILAVAADVARDDDVRRLAECVFSEFEQLHILVNNAGVYGPMGPVETVDWDDWRQALEINLFGPVRMCRAVLPHFRRRRYGKIIQISGGGATSPMPRLEAYAAGKSAVVRFMESLAAECAGDQIDVNSIAPGLLDTQFLDQVLAAGPEAAGEHFYRRMLHARRHNETTPLEAGAALCLFLASPASDGLTGKLISAVWDRYEEWPKHLDELRGSDLYTLRRITGRDRGTAWGDK